MIDNHYPLYFKSNEIVKEVPATADWLERQMDFIQDNQQEYTGFKPKIGRSEKFFFKTLQSYFSNYIYLNKQVGRYYPDFIFYDGSNKLGICIEIDEPTTINGIYTTQIHTKENLPSGRTLFLLNSGYNVLRFTESQVIRVC